MALTGAEESSGLSWIEIHSVRIVPDQNIEARDIRIFVNALEGKTELRTEANELLMRHLSDSEKLVAFSNDTIFVTHRGGDKKKIKISAKDVIERAGGRANFEYKRVDGQTTTFLQVTSKELSSFLVDNSLSFDDSNMDKVFDKQEASSLPEATRQALQEAFSKLTENVHIEALDKVVETFSKFSNVHPIFGIVAKTLLIPYEMWKQKKEFMGDLKTFARDMCTSLKILASAFPVMELGPTKESALKVLKLVVEASRYVDGFVIVHKEDLPDTHRIKTYAQNFVDRMKRVAATQFPKRLEGYRDDLRDRRLDLREAVLAEVLVKSGAMKDRGDDLSYLDRKLKPTEQPALIGGCMEGTRTGFLAEVETWLAPKKVPDGSTSDEGADENSDSERAIQKLLNLLWISGAPGAGKSALASTIISDLLNHNCATFFIKRGATNPRTIWRGIARQLAELDRGVKIDLLEHLSGDGGRAYPQGASIKKQFEELVLGTLKRNFPDSTTSSRRIAVVIDALDECDMSNLDDWRAFLDTIIKWSKELPASWKLVVTSRAVKEIEEALAGVSRRVALTTGGSASKESTDDIERFFKAKFKAASMWPGPDSVTRLTQYAAGLFIWAETVVRFVTQRGADRELRLEMVLGNMAEVGLEDPIGGLYAQILLAAVQELQLVQERNSMSLVLASLVLLKEDLPKMPLLAPNGLASRSSTSIETAFNSLKPIIVTEGRSKVFRVCHESVLDFLLDEKRVHDSMVKLLKNVSDPRSKSTLNTFSHERQHALLAEGCLQMMNSALTNQIGRTSLQPDIRRALQYACVHWVSHLKGAAVDSGANNDTRLELARLIEVFAKRDIVPWMEALSRVGSVREAFESLHNEIHRFPAASWSFAEAILIPYESLVLRQQSSANVMKPLVTDLRATLELMASSFTKLERNDIERERIKCCTTEVQNVIGNASTYMHDFLKDWETSNASRDSDSQLSKQVGEYQSRLGDRLLDFRDAVVMYTLNRHGGLGHLEDGISFLRRKLGPARQPLNDGGCLDGTRTSVLADVDAWLSDSSGGMSNVLWISGAVGTGKTALASTIVSDKLRDFDSCTFFVKRREPGLCDPRIVWPTIVHRLAELFHGVKVDILELMAEHAYPEDASIEDQFRLLVLEPLKKQFPADSLTVGKLVVVIDALDECLGKEGEEDGFLGTIINWSKQLPQTCKLVVTSRPEVEITQKLMDVSHRLDLLAGDDVASKESTADIQHFFEAKLGEMNVCVDGWPDSTSMTRLTQSANGLFVWASTIVEFIRENPVEKLDEVMTHMAEKDKRRDLFGWVSNPTDFAVSMSAWVTTVLRASRGENQIREAITGELDVKEDRVGRLYALYGKILAKVALQLHSTQDLGSLSIVLASLGLLDKPFPVQALHELLPSDQTSSKIELVLEGLVSVTLVEGDNKTLRARHRSFSEFLQDKARFRVLMKNFLVDTRESGFILSTLSLTRSRALLAEGCLPLIHVCCSWAEPFLLDPNIGEDPESCRRLMNSIQPDSKTSSQLDALFLVIDAWPVLQDVFSSTTTMEHVEIIGKAWTASRGSDPSRNIIVSMALLSPYRLWKLEVEARRKCTEVIKALAVEMCIALKTMAIAFPVMACASPSALKLLQSIAEAYEDVDDFVKKGRGRGTQGIVALEAEQFCAEVGKYQSRLREYRLKFRDAALIDALVKSGVLSQYQSSIIFSLADDGREEDQGDDLSYLDRKLDPTKQADLISGCSEGTQKAVLAEVETWLAEKNLSDSRTNGENVLWISGAPGAGKSALASTIISKQLIYQCATFFIKRGATNPRTIWRSMARQLADLDRGVKVDLLELLSGEARHAYPERASIEDHFRQLICESLKRNFPDGPTSSRRIVVVIDALDECDMDDQRDWRAFLDTIITWSKELPKACKLIVTSRAEAEIEKELKGVSRQLALDYGEDVSEESESSHDIRLLFEDAFRDMDR